MNVLDLENFLLCLFRGWQGHSPCLGSLPRCLHNSHACAFQFCFHCFVTTVQTGFSSLKHTLCPTGTLFFVDPIFTFLAVTSSLHRLSTLLSEVCPRLASHAAAPKPRGMHLSARPDLVFPSPRAAPGKSPSQEGHSITQLSTQ